MRLSPIRTCVAGLCLQLAACLLTSTVTAAQGPPPSDGQESGAPVQAPPAPQPSSPTAPPEQTAEPPASGTEPTRFFDTVTVSATTNPAALLETPGTVSVIESSTIARRLIENTADLVKYEPGVYIETTVNRIGLNGFNIRGIGGNRVMTQVDGVETSEQFDFGPFNVHQFTLDLDTLKSAEIIRSSGSSLYGSDALGGVVSFYTKDPADYLGARRFYIGGKTMYDGRGGDASGNVAIAGGRSRVSASLFASYANGHEPRNKGRVETEDARRTRLNPQDRDVSQALAKLHVTIAPANVLRGALEVAHSDIHTNALASRGTTAAGPVVTNVADITSDDTMRRQRASVDQAIASLAVLDQLSWNAYLQSSDTSQVVDERRISTGPAGVDTVSRSGTLDYDQRSAGGTLQARKALILNDRSVLFTAGGMLKHNTFDMIRDRTDIDAATGAIVPATNLILPSKYFPKTAVRELGTFVQAEVRAGRLTIVPGIRYDHFRLDADENDAVYIASLSPTAADLSAGATSARVGAAWRVSNAITVHSQYAEGFRAPPYSAINSGFTNLQGGYTSVPNTELRPESSDNVEFGVRSMFGRVSFGVTGFWNGYDDFILQVQRGLNPATRLLEFQYQNVSEVRIRGIELQGDARLHSTLRLRASYAVIRGNDVSGTGDVPLDTIAPAQGTFGLQFTAPSNRWGSELTTRVSTAQRQAVAGAGMFAPDGFAVLDLVGWASLGGGLVVRGGVMNLTNTTYYEWPNVRGRSSTDPVIDRYTSPGAAGLVSLSYGW